jgi:hypothetical protein
MDRCALHHEFRGSPPAVTSTNAAQPALLQGPVAKQVTAFHDQFARAVD